MRLPSRLKTILLASAVVVVSFVVSLKALDWLSPRAPVVMPKLVELPPLAPASRSSTILAPVSISLAAIRDAAERSAPRNFAGKSTNPVSQVLQDADIGWTASRGPINATGAQDVLSLTTPLTCGCQASVAIKIRIAGVRDLADSEFSDVRPRIFQAYDVIELSDGFFISIRAPTLMKLS